MILRYLTHPHVRIDPAVPVPDWGLSEIGRSRIERACRASLWRSTVRVVSSAEIKAREAAELLAGDLGLGVEIRPAMHENDRSATGFLPPPAFEAMADRFFAVPERSVSGWERAIDAQARIVAEIEAVLAGHVPAGHAGGDILVVGHGAVGTLLLCHFAGLAIDRRHDQPAGGGNVIALDIESRTVLYPWRSLESLVAESLA